MVGLALPPVDHLLIERDRGQFTATPQSSASVLHGRKRAQPLFSPTRARPSKRLRTTGGTTRTTNATQLGDQG